MGKHTGAAGCVDCHMPKRRTEDVVHVAATDHYIQRLKPPDLLAERAERQETGAGAYRGPVMLYYPETLPHTSENDLDLAVAQVKQGSNPTEGIAQLTRAIERYSQQRAEYYLELAEALERNRQPAEALPVFRKAVQRSQEFAGGCKNSECAAPLQYAEAAES